MNDYIIIEGQTSLLIENSDVCSLGVVLAELELLTG